MPDSRTTLDRITFCSYLTEIAYPIVREVLLAEASELKDKEIVTEEEIRRNSSQVGQVLAAAWIQFGVLALRGRRELMLSKSLMPLPNDDVSIELQKALRDSFNSLVIDSNHAARIMRLFGDKYVTPYGGIDFFPGLALDASHVDSAYVLYKC